MSRFVDRSAVERLDLGDGDWVDLRTELSGPEWAFAQRSSTRFLSVVIAAWSLTNDAGEVVPINTLTVADLNEPTFRLIDDWILANIREPTLPNAFAAPSQDSSPGSGSQIQTPKKANSSTTLSWQPAAHSGTSGTPPPSS